MPASVRGYVSSDFPSRGVAVTAVSCREAISRQASHRVPDTMMWPRSHLVWPVAPSREFTVGLLADRCSSCLHACPCGFHGDPTKQCTCSPSAVTRYQHRISGPLLDRIDIFVDVPRVEYEKLTDDAFAEDSADVRARVEASRERQRLRFSESHLVCNSEMGPVAVREFCQRNLDEPAKSLLRMAMNQLSLSARAFHRVLKLARTIADLSGSEVITSSQLAEALQYRRRGGG